MKKIRYIIALAITCVSYNAFSQVSAEADLKALRDLKDTTVLRQRVTQLENSDKEKDLQLLVDYYSLNKDTAQCSRILALAIKKFPYGKVAFEKAANEICYETDGPTNAKRYASMVAKFGNRPEFKEGDVFRTEKIFVALSFAHREPDMVRVWLDKITDSLYRTIAYSYGANELAEAGHYTQAEQLIKFSLSHAMHVGLDSSWYLGFSMAAAGILLAEKKYEEGYPYAKLAYADIKSAKPKIMKSFNTEVNNIYLNYQVANEDYIAAFPMMTESIREGKASQLIKDRFRKAYDVSKGSDNDYDDYYASLTSVLREKIKKDLAANALNEPSFDFKLTDVKGKSVTLASFKGKVVILDFWATWCGPCKASFPKMQLAVNKYKNDPDVAFLFVHTLESSNDPARATADAAKFLYDNNYTFKLAMDLKINGVKGTNPAANGFKLIGIPTKLIIDKAGMERFKVIGGADDNKDMFLAEMDAMIELAKNEALTTNKL